MRASAITAVIFSNSNDEALKELTANRSMASLPFGGRYRLIDFTLSNLVNAGISDIGIVTNANYRSLMDHVGSGIYWDLDRKNGGLSIVPPYIMGSRKHNGYVDSAVRATEYVNRTNCEYVIVCDSGTIANVDITSLINFHAEKEADVSFVYRKAHSPDKFKNTIKLNLNESGRVINAEITDLKGEGDYTIGIGIFNKTVFNSMVNSTLNEKAEITISDIIMNKVNDYNIYGFEHSGFAALMDCRKSYFENNMMLLEKSVRDDLFNRERPIFTKTRDDMPTRYGTHSNVKNSLVADGCIIDGTVKNCILFRGVRVRKGAVVENSILAQGVEVRENAKVKYVVSDKNAVIGNTEPICGTKRKAFIIKKNQYI